MSISLTRRVKAKEIYGDRLCLVTAAFLYLKILIDFVR